MEVIITKKTWFNALWGKNAQVIKAVRNLKKNKISLLVFTKEQSKKAFNKSHKF